MKHIAGGKKSSREIVTRINYPARSLYDDGLADLKSGNSYAQAFHTIMTKRYFVPDLPNAGGPVSLPSFEAQHAIRVMRIKVDDTVELFNGSGLQTEAKVVQLGRNECVCLAEAGQIIDREPSANLHLGIALPKPDRAKELIERLTELGVQRVTPIIAERTQRGPTESILEKLSKVVIEACKQSGRNHLLQISPPATAEQYFRELSAEKKIIAHPCEQGITPKELIRSGKHESYAIAIGPEGGWTDFEYQQAVERDFESINLGKRIYRIETAAVALASVLVS